MVFQQKVGSATKIKSKKAVQSPKPSMFELDANDDDDASEDMDSDDFAESSDEEMDSNDAQAPTKTSNKKTPAKQTPGKKTPAKQTPGKRTPNKKNSLVPDKKVSFELASAKTPIATDSQVGKRQATPASKGKQGVQEFKGLKAGSKNKSQTSLKMGEVDSDEEEENDEDCDEEDDSKQNILKSKLKQKIGNKDEEAEEEDDEEEDDDEEEEDDDDDVEDDDSKQEVLKNKSKQKPEINQNSQQVKNTETDDSLTKQNEKNLEIQKKNKEREDLRNARQLMIRNLPTDITCEEITSLSDDIINVILPEPSFIKNRKFKTVYAFVLFASEENADKNHAAFQSQKLRGAPMECDYSGVKSRNPKKIVPHTCDAMRLHIANLPTDVKVTQIAQLTPSATSILLTPSTLNRSAFVNFDSEEKAAEAFEANNEAMVNGKSVTVLYAVERNFGSYKPFKRGFHQGGRPPFAKRPRQDLDASSQG